MPPAKATKAQPAEAAPKARGAHVTYLPLNPTDPNVVKWNGVTFRANVPMALNEFHYVIIDKPHEIPQGDGTIRTITKQTKVAMVELAKGNPSFKVDGFPRAKVRKSTRVVPPPGAEWTNAHEGEISEADWDTATEMPDDLAA